MSEPHEAIREEEDRRYREQSLAIKCSSETTQEESKLVKLFKDAGAIRKNPYERGGDS